jgi:hypothetical protein
MFMIVIDILFPLPDVEKKIESSKKSRIGDTWDGGSTHDHDVFWLDGVNRLDNAFQMVGYMGSGAWEWCT